MKSKIAIGQTLIGFLLVPVAGYSNDSASDHGSSAKQFVKDSAKTAKVKAKMAKAKDDSAMQIKVDTDNAGVVYLSGKAKSQAEADRAVALAREVEGVTSVESSIVVK